MPSFRPTSPPTTVPSLSPTSSPSYSPTMAPSQIPTNLPSSLPTQSPTLQPSLNPSIFPTLTVSMNPTKQPVPTGKPTVSSVPSSEPSTSLNPSELRVEVDIPIFSIDLISKTKLDESHVVNVAEDYLNVFLKDKFREDIFFLSVELTAEETTRRRLNVETSILCSGIAVFGSKSVPSPRYLEELVEEAFKNSNREFLGQLEDNGIELSPLMNSNPSPQADKGLTKMHLTIIVAIVGAATVVIVVSLYIQRHHQRSSEKKVQALGQHYQFQSQVKEYNLDIDYLEPQPLEISDDDRAIERNMVRSEYERTVIRKANEKLRHTLGQRATNREQKTVRFGSNIAYGSNGTIVSENQKYDEEGTISSIHFSSSLESNVSSLGGLNPIPENEDTNYQSPENSPDKIHTPRSFMAVAAVKPTKQPKSQPSEPEIANLPPTSPRNLPVGGADNTEGKEPPHELASTVIGVLSPQSILSSIGFSFGSEPFQLDSLDDESDGGDEPTIDSALYNFSVSTTDPPSSNSRNAELPCNAQIQVSAADQTSDDGKHESFKFKRPNFFKRLASPRKGKNDAERPIYFGKSDKVAGRNTDNISAGDTTSAANGIVSPRKMYPHESVENNAAKPEGEISIEEEEIVGGGNFFTRLTSPRKNTSKSRFKNDDETEKVAASIGDSMDKNQTAQQCNTSPMQEEVQNTDHNQGSAAEQNPQSENSYFTSIFTRKY